MQQDSWRWLPPDIAWAADSLKSKLPVWTGSSWTAPQASRSIAWAIADAARNGSYGARLPDSRIDLAALLALDAVWAARGDRFDGRFDSAASWWEAVARIARAGRARIFLQSGRLRVVRDGPETLPVALFSMRNIVRGSFAVDYAMPTAETADAVEVAYYDGDYWTQRRVTAKLPGAAGKQLSRPRWQVGPRGRACTSSVSASQSASSRTSSSSSPLVSPFIHSRCLLRLKKVTRPLARVASSAARSM